MARDRQIILDTETTGLYPQNGDRILEFAGLEMKNRQLTGRHLHLFIHPDRDVPEEVVAIHGISLAVLEEKNAPKFAAVAGEIADFIRGAELIIHNARFDVGFLNAEFERLGLPTVEELDCEITDTLAMAKKDFPGQKSSLDALCTRFEIDRSKRVYHGALIDCELLAEVYLAMTRRQHSLIDVFEETGARQNAAALSEWPANLRIRTADAEEHAEHEAYLDALEQAAGQALWRQNGTTESA